MGVEDESAGNDESQASESTATEKTLSLTQSELTALLSKEAAKAERSAARSAEQKLAERLNGRSVEEVNKIIEAHNQRTEQEKTEAQRASELAEAASRERDEAKAEAARVKHESLIERRLLKAGVPDEQLDRVRKLINTGVEGSVEDIDGEIEELKADLPGLFGTSKGREMANSDVSGGSKESSTSDDAFTRGKKRAEARFTNRF